MQPMNFVRNHRKRIAPRRWNDLVKTENHIRKYEIGGFFSRLGTSRRVSAHTLLIF